MKFEPASLLIYVKVNEWFMGKQNGGEKLELKSAERKINGINFELIDQLLVRRTVILR